ncbi:MAG: hypothetical protein WEC84_02365 [Candidatus Andersenbacteria bacterium]
MRTPSIEAFEPPFQKDEYSPDEAYCLRPFFTNREEKRKVPQDHEKSRERVLL